MVARMGESRLSRGLQRQILWTIGRSFRTISFVIVAGAVGVVGMHSALLRYKPAGFIREKEVVRVIERIALSYNRCSMPCSSNRWGTNRNNINFAKCRDRRPV